MGINFFSVFRDIFLFSFSYCIFSEYNQCSDPLSVDTDHDNLFDGFEVYYGTNILLFDTDGDTYGDGVEVLSGTNPLDAGDYPGSNVGDDTSTDDTNPFGNIPGYTPTIFMMIFISTIGILIIKKRK
ncbi:MAG: hypothetical protein DRO88_14115 [Promethearchaeia archaeon]|nr:MAG: hypothetical protein DRO88_14115 [Candidatus Lokiarchaeia archaeon]